MNGESDDAELVGACRQGDTSAFEILVRRHQKGMLNLAFRMLGDYDEACDVVQDAFVAAYKGLSSFRGDARFTTWLTTITVNQARNRLGQLAARRRNEAYSLDAPLAAGDCDLYPDPPSPAPSVLDMLEEQALRRKVGECIAALPPDFREVLVLRDLQERSYDEIGTILNMRDGTVKSRLFRAREGVKECLKRVMESL